jgi:purine nucleosidase
MKEWGRKWRRGALAAVLACVLQAAAQSAPQKYVVVDQDASGPAGSDMQALLVFLQSPEVHLLGITVVTGDAWRNEEVAHTLRLLELVGRTDVKVYPGAELPLVRTQEETRVEEQLYGKQAWLGAWGNGPENHAADVIPAMEEGAPLTKAADEDAAHFMVRMVHAHPHEVTIFGAGPMTNIALAVRLDPEFARLAKELVIMGGSLNPQTEDPEFLDDPRHEFNFWFDPEAASIVLRAPWAKITDTTVDASIETKLTEEMFAKWAKAESPAARYLVKYTKRPLGFYMWDELAAALWLDPALVKRERVVYMDVNTAHGATWGDTLTWSDRNKPALPLNQVHAVVDVDFVRLQAFLVELFSHPAPGARDAAMR